MHNGMSLMPQRKGFQQKTGLKQSVGNAEERERMGLTNVKGDGECSPGGLAILQKSSLRQWHARLVGERNCGRLYVVKLCCPEISIAVSRRSCERLDFFVRKECTWSTSVWEYNTYWVSTPQQKIELRFLILINVRKPLRSAELMNGEFLWCIERSWQICCMESGTVTSPRASWYNCW